MSGPRVVFCARASQSLLDCVLVELCGVFALQWIQRFVLLVVMEWLSSSTTTIAGRGTAALKVLMRAATSSMAAVALLTITVAHKRLLVPACAWMWLLPQPVRRGLLPSFMGCPPSVHTPAPPPNARRRAGEWGASSMDQL